ncbi:hypothetical protein SPSE_0074 [Staphylococcus pseudintermedius ED99]|nr:hypothetical protein SPSE_0074 [Staphylococcus pseudintermedius ED99]
MLMKHTSKLKVLNVFTDYIKRAVGLFQSTDFHHVMKSA